MTCGENDTSNQMIFSLKATLRPGEPLQVRAILDTCAKTSFVTREIAEKYQIPNSVSQNTTLRGIGARAIELPMSKCTFRLFSILNGEFVDVHAFIIDKICDDIPPLLASENIFPPLPAKTLTESFPRKQFEPVDILLSAAVMSQILGTNITRCGPNNTVILMETTLGQGVGGTFTNDALTSLAVSTQPLTNDQLLTQLKQFWNWETLGVTSQPQRVLSKEDQFAIDFFEQNLSFSDKHYQIAVPFLPDARKPLNNYNNVLKMFSNLERSLLKDKEKYDAYVPAFEAFIENDFFELVPAAQEKKSENVFYLPHFAVIRQGHATTAVRVVKNAAATDRAGVSLNSALAQGPLLLHDLFDQLVNFRHFKVPFCADVQQLFLMVGVAPKDRDFLRLLWRNPGTNEPLKTYRMKVLPFGLNCSPYLAQAVVQKHLDKYEKRFPEAVALLRQCLYCDDLLAGALTEQKAITLRNQIQTIMNDASMNMRKWLSSSKVLMATIPDELQAKNAKLIMEEAAAIPSQDMPKTLGVCWNPTTDSFNFVNVESLTYTVENETMRSLASRAAKLYDPLGLIAPITIVAKALMQECYKAELTWDSVLPEYILKPWEEWKAELHLLSQFSLPRYVLTDNVAVTELHSFSDASERACSAVVFLRVVTHSGYTKSTLIASKTKLAPLKLVTIPRLELLAAELSAKLVTKIQNSLKVDRVICWIDSLSVLQWLNKPSSHWKTYVGNRVAAITELVEPSVFRYCSTHENIADLPSRGTKVEEFLKYSTWVKGPLFLDEPEILWPTLPVKSNLDLAKLENVIQEERRPAETFVLAIDEDYKTFFESVFVITRPFLVGLRILCWVKRFLKKARKQAVTDTKYVVGPEMREALQEWLIFVQKNHFADEISKIQKGDTLHSSPLAALQPQVNANGLLCVGGRITQAVHLAIEVRHPAILPKHDKYVQHFVLHLHAIHAHASPETCLFILRQKYWLIGGRSEVKRILRTCSCYKLRAKPFQTRIASLPIERLTPVEAFVNIGFDTFGHFDTFLEISGVTHSFKTYVIIFTCLVTRAVHVELVYNLSTLEFLNAFERFIATRGQVKKAVCDNQTAFRKASKQMKRLYTTLDWDRVAKWCTDRYEPIEIKFNVPLSPWHGGVFERMVGSMKKALRATVGTQSLDLPKLATLLKSAESVVNQRPLTYVPNEPNDPLPLSPDMILIGRKLGSLPDSLANDATASKIDILWKKRQKLQSEFGVRFQREYITTLLPAAKWTKPGFAPREGEVVLIHKETRNRMFWPLGIVTKLHYGRDNVVRSCDLRLPNGDTMKRPISLLLRLEATEVVVPESDLKEAGSTETPTADDAQPNQTS